MALKLVYRPVRGRVHAHDATARPPESEARIVRRALVGDDDTGRVPRSGPISGERPVGSDTAFGLATAAGATPQQALDFRFEFVVVVMSKQCPADDLDDDADGDQRGGPGRRRRH